MNENHIIIKERNKGLLSKGIVYLVLMTASLLIAFLPYLSPNVTESANIFYIVGGILFLIFTVLFVFLLYKECKPADALIITSRGFTDLKNVGESIIIDWTNVASVKLFGKKDMPFLGITLENSDIVMAKMKKAKADLMRENIEENLPNILIAQSEIRTSVKELKDLFVKFVREARALDSSSAPKKQKNNPFSTDDVLRAFGKLPKAEQKNEVEEVLPDPQPTITEKQAERSADEDPTETNGDAFYNMLQKQLATEGRNNNDSEYNCNTNDNNIDNDVDDAYDGDDINDAGNVNDVNEVNRVEINNYNDVIEEKSKESIKTGAGISAEKPKEEGSEDVISDEMKALLSRAKSTRISELGKILNEKEVPFSISRDEPKERVCADTSDIIIIPSDLPSDDSSKSHIDEKENPEQISFDILSENEEENYSETLKIDFSETGDLPEIGGDDKNTNE